MPTSYSHRCNHGYGHKTTSTSYPNPNRHPIQETGYDDDDNSSEADEEEVLFDLDEAALSQLPLRLQKNMREIQIERVARFQIQKNNNIKITPHQDSGIRHGSSRDRGRDRPKCSNRDLYAENWLQNVLERISVARELDLGSSCVSHGSRYHQRTLDVDMDMENNKGTNVGTDRHTHTNKYTQERRLWSGFYNWWSPGSMKGAWVATVASYRGVVGGRVQSLGTTTSERLFGGYGNPATAWDDRYMSSSSGFDDQSYGTYNDISAEEGSSGHVRVRGTRKRSLSMVSAVRSQVRKRFQRMSKLVRM